ncbi:AAA family ATPase [Anaplasma marginale]|uniref:hypothetical protein n=1 Tax=Anaplasma marginale TaxID=770 RepID=UPI00140362B4|nr:hypothetical protein [Anaplasma marginale]
MIPLGGGGHHSSGVSVTSAVTAAGDVVSGAGDSSQDQGIPTGAAESSAVSGGECSSAEAEAFPNVQKLLDILADPDVVRLIAAALPKLLETVARKGSQQGLRAIDAKHGLSAAPDTDSINAKASAARSTQVANWKLKQECRDIDAKYERERFAVASWWVRKELRCELRAIDRKYGLRKELSAIDINRKAYTALCARIASWQLKQELRAIDEKYRARIELQAELREIDEKYKREVDLQRALRAAEIAWQAREELRRELRAIDARTELYQELRAIDEKYKSRVELQAELRAIDAKCTISRLAQQLKELSLVVEELEYDIEEIDYRYPPGTEGARKMSSNMLRDIYSVYNATNALSAKIKEIAVACGTYPPHEVSSSGVLWYGSPSSGEAPLPAVCDNDECGVEASETEPRTADISDGAATAREESQRELCEIDAEHGPSAAPGTDSINAKASATAARAWTSVKQGLECTCASIRSKTATAPTSSAGGSCAAAHTERGSEGSGSTFTGTFQAITSRISGACRSCGTAAPSATLDDILFAPAQQAQGAAL